MRIPLIIDGGSTCGWALVKEGMLKPRAGEVEMPDTKNIGRFCNAFAEWMIPFCQLEGVTEVGVEAPIISDHGGSGVNVHEVDKLFGIVHAVEMAADRLGIRCERISRGTVCKHVSGTGKGTRRQLKTYCMLACQRKGWKTASEDIADAMATLDYWTWKEKIPVGWNNQPAPGPMFATAGVVIDKSNQIAAARILNKALSFDGDKA